MARKLDPAQPRGVTWNGAGGCVIFSQSRQANLSRTVWMTFHERGITSSVSVTSSPSLESRLPPHAGHEHGAETTIHVQRQLKSDDVLAVLTDLFAQHGPPAHIRSDNGAEFTANVVREWLGRIGVKTLYIEPGSPWENGYNESFYTCTIRSDRTARCATSRRHPKPSCLALVTCPTLRSGQSTRATITAGL